MHGLMSRRRNLLAAFSFKRPELNLPKVSYFRIMQPFVGEKVNGVVGNGHLPVLKSIESFDGLPEDEK